MNSRNNEIAMDRVPYKKLIRQVFASNASQIEVTSTTCVGLNSAYQILDKYLNDFLSSSHPPTLIHLQSSFTTAEMRASVPALQNLPIMRQDLNLMNSRVQDLTWRKDVAMNAITAFYQSFDDFADRLRCARYAEIPLGNLATDLGVQLNDVSFGRLLLANRHILWSSPENMPDLGNHDIKGILGK
jgi:DNA polymerase